MLIKDELFRILYMKIDDANTCFFDFSLSAAFMCTVILFIYLFVNVTRNKKGDSLKFNWNDQCCLYSASIFIAVLLSRVNTDSVFTFAEELLLFSI